MASAYLFELLIPGVDLSDDVADALAVAGCTDALLSSLEGLLVCSFERSGPDALEVVEGARAAVCAALGLPNGFFLPVVWGGGARPWGAV